MPHWCPLTAVKMLNKAGIQHNSRPLNMLTLMQFILLIYSLRNKSYFQIYLRTNMYMKLKQNM